MSHSVTVTRTTTTSTTSAILLNIGYFKKPIGILKLLHVLLGIVVVGIIGNYISYYYGAGGGYYGAGLFVPELFFLLIATTCMIASAILLFSCFVSIATATILPKTIFELLFHGFAVIFLLISAAVYTAKLHDYSQYKNHPSYSARLAAGELVHFPILSFLLFVSSAHCLHKVIARNAIYLNETITEPGYGAKIFASILGLINAVLYGIATYLSYKAYKTG